MAFDSQELGSRVFTFFVPTLFSLAFHEFGHAASAVMLGDQTPREQGRLTLNPLVHVDPLGTLVLPLALILMGQPPFGWAKPVIVTPYRFTRRLEMRTGLMITAAAGPLMNLLLAVACALAAVGAHRGALPGGPGTVGVLEQLAGLNVVLCLFNLLPLPPLDGSRVVSGLLPVGLRSAYQQLERLSPALLGLLFFTGAGAALIEGPSLALLRGLGSLGGALFP
jgi:Zn-dependent protease